MICRERRHDDEPGSAGSVEADIERVLVCASCKHPITKESERLDAFGGHVHDRVNPSGSAFRIGLFSNAEGVIGVGTSSDEFSWFPAHRWRVALCGGCFVHLGWSFSSADGNAFHGLVLDQLESG